MQGAKRHCPGPLAQVLKHRGERGLVVALRQSAILISQTVAQWKVIAKVEGTSSQVELYTAKCRESPKTLAMKNGWPYMSKDLFWEAMEDIASQTTLVTGHPWSELKEMIREQVQKTYPMIHAVQEVVPAPAPPIQVSFQPLPCKTGSHTDL